jgi:drug/metabolite transporter (DMT)-like permease
VALGALALVWGTQYLVIKHGQADVPPLLTVALRFSVVAAVGGAVALLQGARAPRGLGGPRLLFAAAQALSMGALYWSETRLPTAVTALVFAMVPLFVASLAHLFIATEPLGRRTAAAMLLGFVGVVAMGGGEWSAPDLQTGALVGIAVAVGGAVCNAANKVVAKRITDRVPVAIMLRDMGAVVAVVAAGAWWLGGARAPVFTPRAVAAFVYLGLVASAGASGLYLVLLRRFRVTGLSYLQFVSALIALVTGVALGGERFGLVAAVGVAAVLGGLWLLLAQPTEQRAD